MIVSDDDFGRISKESTVDSFKVLFQYFLGGTEENRNNLRQDNLCPEEICQKSKFSIFVLSHACRF
jgi:hypothetical protein